LSQLLKAMCLICTIQMSSFGEWKYHSANPIIKSNKHFSQSGGMVLVYENKLYRFTQGVEPYYGIQVFVFEITELTETSYSE